jgi:ribosomal protein S6--L-glutamate ligase
LHWIWDCNDVEFAGQMADNGTGMKIGILSRNQILYSTRRLLQAARQRGHEVTVLDTLAVATEMGIHYLPAHASNWRSSFLHQPVKVDAIIPRIGASITAYGLEVVRQFEKKGSITTATADAIAQSRDKLRSLRLMNEAGLPVPRTIALAQIDDVEQAVAAVGGLPVVIKVLRGTQGKGVILASDVATIQAITAVTQPSGEQFLLQEYIKESAGHDIRVLVVGHRCVAAMRRSAAAGNFRSNLHQGGTAVKVVLNSAVKNLAIAAAHAHHLGVAGVDILESERGPLVLEVNSSPGLEGIERVTGADVADNIIRYLEQAFTKQKNRKSGPRR